MMVQLTPSQQKLVDEILASSRYEDESAVVTAALEALRERRRDREEALAEIREKIDHGYEQTERGELLDGPAVMAEMQERLQRWRVANEAE